MPAEATRTVPDHVPQALVTDLDIYDLPGAADDPQAAWLAFRGNGPLVWSSRNGGHWVPTEGADVAAMFRDAQLFSSASVTIPSVPGEPMLPLEADPPVHGEYRRAVLSFLTPARVRALEPEIRQLTVDLIEAVRPAGACDFIEAFAHRLPLIIVLKLMDLPLADRGWLHGLTEIFARHPDLDAKVRAYLDLRAYLADRIAERRDAPGDDLISHLIAATVDGRPLTAAELLSTCTMVALAGLDTVAAMFGFVALFLARDPAARVEIRARPDRLPAVVAELLRRYSTSNMGRVLTRDIDHRGVAMKAGDHVMLSPSLHNLDPALFPDPLAVDFDRPPRHISFGTGNHSCAGAQLARMEIRIFLEEWLARIPDFAIEPGAAVPARAGPVNTIDRLPLVWPAPVS